MLLTKPQYGYILGLYKKINVDLTEDDKYVIQGFSIEEAQTQISKLKEMLGIDDKKDALRKGIISMAKSIGWLVENPANSQEPKIDLERLENWCLKYGMFHKALNEMTEAELGKTLKQFQFGPYKTKMDK